jgi:glutamate/tyrosine decarboxylase-like PLP-dependent enzyme
MMHTTQNASVWITEPEISMSTGMTGRGTRNAPLEMSPAEFRTIGHQLVDRLAAFLEGLPHGPVTHDSTPPRLQAVLGKRPLPDRGESPARIVEEAAELLIRHSLFNGHPKFWGFITSSAAPIGALADFIAATVNPNVGGWVIAPMASEIERQTVRWIAELLGYPADAGGVLVSGGNMANMVGFWVGRRVRTPWDLRTIGLDESARPLRVYVSQETHTWIQKATDLSGLGTNAIRWIETDRHLRMDLRALRKQIEADRAAGDLPIMVVGTAGSVSTGAIDALGDIAAICHEHNLWFHVDGAYGAPAAALPEAPGELKALAFADSLAVDPHKWLYSPLEAGCALVRDANALRDTFSFHPSYYPEREEATQEAPIFYHEFGPQNSRGFRALKVWMGLRQAGRNGCTHMIRDDIELAKRLFDRAQANPELEALTHSLSITTFRYVPPSLRAERSAEDEAWLDTLNREIMNRLQAGGEAFVTNAVIRGRFALRACVVNFRTTAADIDDLIELVVRLGRELNVRPQP